MTPILGSGPCQTESVHYWSVGGAVIEASVLGPTSAFGNPPAPGGLLLVQNRREGGHMDWTPPGGVIDAGERLLEGLTREVLEETGLLVRRWAAQPLYEIEAHAPDLGWTLTVQAHLAVDVEGTVRIGTDPDGIVVGADVVALDECEERLGTAHPWVREPLMEWLSQRWEGTRGFRYRVHGRGLSELRVVRLDV